MKKIYVAHSGEYSDRCVMGVFSTRVKAEKFSNDVEEHLIDLQVVVASKKLFPYWVRIKLSDGSIDAVSAYPENPHSFLKAQIRVIGIYAVINMWARDAEHAVKIATDLRRMELAKQ